MKRIFLSLLLLAGSLALKAQKPQPIQGYARVSMPMEWYAEQSKAWKKVLDQSPKDANAWYNYYYANRIMGYHLETREERDVQQKKIDRLMEDMGREIPDSYEYNLCKWMAGGFDLKLLPYLEKAVAMGKGRTEHIDFMVNISEIKRDMKKRDRYCLEKLNAGMISTGMMYYNYNVMAGLDSNGIIVTAGDNDTYPAWVLQAKNIRRDVTIVNLSLIQIEEYRNRVFKELGVPAPEKTEEELSQFKIIELLAGNKKGYPLYISLSASGCKEIVDSTEEHLYLEGLAYRYSKEPVDNMAILKRNFEQRYRLDNLDLALYPDISEELVKLINCNYALPMLKLVEHYKLSGDKMREQWMREKLMVVAQYSPQASDIKKYLDQL